MPEPSPATVNSRLSPTDTDTMRIRLLGATLALAVASTVTGACAALAPATAQAAGRPMVFGLTDHWKDQVDRDDRQLGTHSSIVGIFLNWQTTGTTATVNWMSWVRSRGAAPMIDLSPPSSVRLWGIAHGTQDGYLRSFARAFRAWRHPVLLRVLPEMNGGWESYSPGKYGQTTAQYVYAFRHIVSVFRGVGATNVQMMWNPNRVYQGSTPLSTLWPGARYVNWAAIDAYNWHDRQHGVYTPSQLLAGTVTAIHRLTTKPIMLAELGVAPFSGKPTYVRNVLNTAQQLGLKAAVWFDEQLGGGPDWRLDSTPAGTLTSAVSTVHQPNIAWSGHGVSLAQVDSLVVTGSY